MISSPNSDFRLVPLGVTQRSGTKIDSLPTSSIFSISRIYGKGIYSIKGGKRKQQSLMGSSQSVPEQSIHEFTVKDSRGRDVDLSIYKGKVLLVVNVASKCGLTDSNYTQLTELYSKYKDKGLEILAFPCNQFLNQEPGTSLEAASFACTRYMAEYPVFQKICVNGPDTAPVYKYLKASKAGGTLGSRVKWNFTKFLVDKEGHVISRYSPTKAPLSIEREIQKALGV